MNKTSKFSPEIRERAVRMVLEHQGEHESQWAAISSIASKIGCTAAGSATLWDYARGLIDEAVERGYLLPGKE